MSQAHRKQPTVTDVAKLAGVGASTVSRVLRGGRHVGASVVERVNLAVQDLGYQPDETARALRMGRTRTLGVIFPQVANTFFSRSVQLIEEEARRRGCAVVLLTHQESPERLLAQLSVLKRYRADGIIVSMPPQITLDDVRAILPEVPMVSFDRSFSGEVDTIHLRNREAARTATEHLLQHGYSSIACITAKPDIDSFRERVAGYKEALESHQRTVQLLEAPDYEQLRYAVTAMLSGRSRPDALLSLSNMATLSVLEAFEELALGRDRRPAIIGFDDFDLAALLDPPLTVVRQPIANMVRYALTMLFRRIDGETAEQLAEPQMVALPAELICRRSCGCP